MLDTCQKRRFAFLIASVTFKLSFIGRIDTVCCTIFPQLENFLLLLSFSEFYFFIQTLVPSGNIIYIPPGDFDRRETIC